MAKVRSRARCRTDRAGDPLDGLVNLFDLGIVLAVAFLVAALQSLHLTEALTKGAGKTSIAKAPSVVLNAHQKIVPLKPGQKRVTISGKGRIGSVYRLANGELVYVQGHCALLLGVHHLGSKPA